ncbi:MAG: acyltransferase [Bacteroidota bacterium]
MGVDFFFVLSGFLITYLLAFEKLNNGTINGKKYFLRRSLRIWPLFYLGVLIAYSNIYISGKFSLGTNDGYSPNIFFSLSFLENYRMIFQDNFPNGAPLRVLWSVCVEEHFYFIWFLLFRVFSLKRLTNVFIILWLTGIAYRIGFYFLFPQKSYYDFDVVSKLDFFCAGGLAGLQIATGFEQLKKSIFKINVFTRNGFTIPCVIIFLFSPVDTRRADCRFIFSDNFRNTFFRAYCAYRYLIVFSAY